MPHTDTTILLTGATSGLGRAVAHHLATRSGHIVLHGRNQRLLAELADELSDAEATVDVVRADLSDLGQVQQLAASVAELTDHLEVVVHNAGVGKGASDRRQLSADGYELRLAVNHLAPFALTWHLLPLLRTGAPSRIVNVASGAQEPLDFADPQLEQGYSGNRAYAQSKFAMVATGFMLATMVPSEVTTVNSVHPATLMPTRMVEEGYGRTVDELQTGVDSVLRLIQAPELADVSGQYFSFQQPARAHPAAYDVDVQQQLWSLSEQLTGLKY